MRADFAQSARSLIQNSGDLSGHWGACGRSLLEKRAHLAHIPEHRAANSQRAWELPARDPALERWPVGRNAELDELGKSQ